MTRVLLVPDLPAERWPSMDRYASRIAQHLRREAPDMEYVLAGRIADLTDEDGGTRPSPYPTGPPADTARFEAARYVDRYLRYPRRVRRMPADLVHVLDHSYGHIVETHADLPALVTVHDLLPALTVRRRAASVRHRVRNFFLQRVLRALRQARGWIVTTTWMRNEFAEWLGRDDGIAVIPYGVDDGFFSPPGEAQAGARARLGLPEDSFVIVHVGSVTERKNLPGVIAAVGGLRRRGIDARLLQVGGQFTASQRADIAERQLTDAVAQSPRVTEGELRSAYGAANALLFPSHYEGFGLPLLEAMASGVPVVTSSTPATAEVAGDAGVVVPGRDPERYVDALERIATDGEWSARLRRLGAARARQFTWAETARRTAEVYRSLA